MIDDIFDEDIEDTPDDAGDDTPDDGDTDNADEGTPEPEKKPEPEKAPEPEKKPEPQKAPEVSPELLIERAKSERANGDLKRLLDSLGYSDVDSYLADQAGVSKDEYVQRQRDAQLLAEAKAQATRAKYAQMAANDLAALKGAGLVDTGIKDIRELTNVRRFAELREMGLSPVEAYRAAAGSSIDARIEKKVQRAADDKAHLTPPKHRGGSPNNSIMSTREKIYYREILPGASDKEIEAAWKRAKGIK